MIWVFARPLVWSQYDDGLGLLHGWGCGYHIGNTNGDGQGHGLGCGWGHGYGNGGGQ